MSPDGSPAGTPLRAVVDAASPIDADRGLIRLAASDMARLGLGPGDVVAASGRSVVHGRAMSSRPGRGGPGRVALDAAQRETSGLGLGAAASLSVPPPPPDARRVRLRAEGAGGALDAALAGAQLQDRPVRPGDVVGLRRAVGGVRRFTVDAVEPSGLALIRSDTVVEIAPRPAAAPGGAVGDGRVAGLGPQQARLREMIELPLRRPDLYARLGLAPPRGVLFTGPPGTGKTLLARSVAEGAGIAFLRIDGPEIVSKHYGDSEAKLREIFAKAEASAPAAVFIDEIDAIAPRRDALSGERQLERRIVGQLLTLMDGLADRGGVVVIAATNQPEAIDPALRRPGRFDRELAFGAPDAAARQEILALHLAGAPTAAETDLASVAAGCGGFVGADLAALAREAGTAAVARLVAAAGDAEAADAADLRLEPEDFAAARAVVGPSLLRGAAMEAPETGWADVGGHAEAKRLLTEAVIWPMAHPEACRRLGVTPAAGVLLSGAPGGGKTLLARALAGESGANFVPVSGPALLSRYLGDAERAVEAAFSRARHAAPSILFLDEIDAIAPRRGAADAALDRVVAQLLVEIDGVERRPGVFLLGATNRPEAIDPALTRPGRFDVVIELGTPDVEARLEILTVQTRSVPLARDVSLDALAAETEGWSGADLAALVQGAARQALRRAAAGVSADAAELLAPEDFAAALEERRSSERARRGLREELR